MIMGILVTIGIFLVAQLIAGIWWASKTDTQVNALWKKHDSFDDDKQKLSELFTKVDTMWEFQVRRAFTEVVVSGLGKMNSPLIVDKDASEKLSTLKEPLRKIYNEFKDKMSDMDLLLEIERHFGDQLLKVVCIPCKISHGACLVLALSVAKDNLHIYLESDTKEKTK